jgi:hypothetical protein
MENHRDRTSEELAAPEAELRGFRIPTRASRNAASTKKPKPPEVTTSIDCDVYSPGDFLTCEYEVKLFKNNEIAAVETSVIWITEGKGEQNIGVHFFERRQQSSLNNGAFDIPQRLSSVLPASPLSYEGEILKIRWAVRIRLFMVNGEHLTEDTYFVLGNVASFEEIRENMPAEDKKDASDDSEDSKKSKAS